MSHTRYRTRTRRKIIPPDTCSPNKGTTQLMVTQGKLRASPPSGRRVRRTSEWGELASMASGLSAGPSGTAGSHISNIHVGSGMAVLVIRFGMFCLSRTLMSSTLIGRGDSQKRHSYRLFSTFMATFVGIRTCVASVGITRVISNAGR